MSAAGLSRCSALRDCTLWRILEVTKQLGAPIDLHKILGLVIDAALHVLKAERGTVFLFDESSNELYSQVATGAGEIRFPADKGIAGETAQTRSLVNVPDCYSDPRFNREVDRQTGYKTRCLLSIPLIGIDDQLVGVLQVLNKHSGVFHEDDEELARALAAQCAVALQRSKLIHEYMVKQKLEQDLALARDIQQGILPKQVPEVEGYEIAAWSKPADETGGDIYDLVGLEEAQVALLLGDATGHGIGPALSVSQLRSMFRIALRLGADLDSVFAHINAQLTADLSVNRFITAFLGILDPASHRIIYHAGGQGPLLHFHASTAECEWLEASTVPMGILAGLKPVQPSPIEMGPGDVLGLFSDGFFEYKNPEEEDYGKERVADLVVQNRNLEAEALISSLCASVEVFSRGIQQDDDMTAVVVRRLP